MKGLLLLLVLAGESGDGTHAEAAPARGGERQWFVLAGYGSAISLGPGTSDVESALLAPQWSLRLTRHIEYLVEANFTRYFSPDGHFAGVVPLGVRLSAGSRGERFYFALGAGLGWTDLTRLPEIDRRFNFLLQGGLGMRWSKRSSRDYFVEIRLVHLSNGGTDEPNLGLNSLALLSGWRVP